MLAAPAGSTPITRTSGCRSASQDIVIDAYRIELLGEDDERQAWGLAGYVWGYRLALLASATSEALNRTESSPPRTREPNTTSPAPVRRPSARAEATSPVPVQ